MGRMILIVGATGTLGAPAARRLRADGFDVRLLARDPDKARRMFDGAFEVVAGDVTDVAGLEQALAGCWGAHISVGGAVDQISAENVAGLASELGLERVSYLSGSTVAEQNRWFPMVEQKLMAEKAVRECGVPYTIFCPTWPFEMLARFVRGGQATVIGKHPRPYHWFAAEDLARMVSNAYQQAEAADKRFYIHGPEAITMQVALERYCQALHPEIESVSTMPTWLAKAMGVLTRNDMLKFASDLMAYFDKVSELGDPTEANNLLGAPTITLDEWIEGRRTAVGQLQGVPQLIG